MLNDRHRASAYAVLHTNLVRHLGRHLLLAEPPNLREIGLRDGHGLSISVQAWMGHESIATTNLYLHFPGTGALAEPGAAELTRGPSGASRNLAGD